MKMKKAVLLGPGKVEIQEVDMPTAPAGGVVVKVASCAVCGTDVENYLHGQRMSQLPPDLGHELTCNYANYCRRVQNRFLWHRIHHKLAP